MRTAVGIALLLAASCPAFGDPGPTIRYLMATPVSEFSYGLDRLDRAIDEAFSDAGAHATVLYSFEKNMISIYANNVHVIKATNEGCRQLIVEVRRRLGVNQDGKPYPPAATSLVAFFFSPLGYTIGDEPADLGVKLDDIVELNGYEIGADNIAVNCRTMLTGSQIMFSE